MIFPWQIGNPSHRVGSIINGSRIVFVEIAMLSRTKTAFTRHPHAVGESYFEHFGAAMRYCGTFLFCAFCAFLHAFLPFLFEKTASTTVRKMVADMNARSHAPQGTVETTTQAAE